MQDNQTVNIMKQDYVNLFNDHVVLFINHLESIFEKYPQVDGVVFGSKSFIVNGASINRNKCSHEQNLGNYEKPQPVKYYAYTQDSTGTDVRMISLFEQYEGLFDAYYQITLNPHLKTLALDGLYSVPFLKKDLKKSITQFFGKDAAQYYISFKEKSLIQTALTPSGNKKSPNSSNSAKSRQTTSNKL